MSRWVLSPAARRDLRAATRWIARENVPASRAFVDAAVAAANLLAERPMIGTIRSQLLPAPYRFWSLPRFTYLIVYRPEPDLIRIVRVLHTSRDLGTVLSSINR